MATVAKSDRSTTITLASASAGPFDLDFRLFDTDAISLYVNGEVRTGYFLDATFLDGYDDNATVALLAPLEAGDVLVIDGDLAPRREVEFLNGPGLVDKLNIEEARQWSAISETKRDTKRSIRTIDAIAPIQEDARGRANTVLGFDADGAANVTPIDDLGATGPEGPQGPQGPAGADGADADVSALVAKAGSTMTGQLILSGVPTNDLGAAPKQMVDAVDNRVTAFNDLLQSSTTDTSANAILQMNETGLIGPFGLGSTIPDPIADIDATTIRVGTYRCIGGGTSGTFPSGVSTFGMLRVERYDATSLYQTYHGVNKDRLFYRRYFGSVWSAWREIVMQDPSSVAAFLAVAGGEMAGPLVLDADPLQDMEAATRRYVDGAVNFIYASRAEAEAATVARSSRFIWVETPHGVILEYVEADVAETNIALTTGDGRKWVPPANYASPQHWKENTDPGTTDMTDAVNAALGFLSFGPIDSLYAMNAAIRSTGGLTFDMLGEVVGVSSPIVMGDLDADLSGSPGDPDADPIVLPTVSFDGRGCGLATNIRWCGGILKALDDFDATPLATFTITNDTYPDNDSPLGTFVTVPGYVLMIGTYDNIDRNDFLSFRPYVTGIEIEIDVDCNFKTGGIYIENAGVKIMRNNVLNLGESGDVKPGSGLNPLPRTAGILTVVSNNDIHAPNALGVWSPRRIKAKATELVIDNVTVYGFDRRTGNRPVGWTEDSYNCVGFSIHVADFWMQNWVATAVTTSAIYDGLFNAQIHGSHAWANEVLIGPDCSGLTITNTYADFTDWKFYSFEHNLTGFNLRAGDSNLILIATQENETAEGLNITGLSANKNSTILYQVDTSVDAAASWVGDTALKHVFSGIQIEEDSKWSDYIPGAYRVCNGIGGARGEIINMATNFTYDHPTDATDFTTFNFSRGAVFDIDYNADSAPIRSELVFNVQGVSRFTIDEDTPSNIRFQQFENDAADNRALLVGSAFGLGAESPTSIGNINASDRETGFYRTSDTTTGDFPTGVSKFGYLEITRYDADNCVQTYRSVVGDSFYTRRYRSGWQDWYQFTGTVVV